MAHRRPLPLVPQIPTWQKAQKVSDRLQSSRVTVRFIGFRFASGFLGANGFYPSVGECET